MAETTIFIPVYNAYEATAACLSSLAASLTSNATRLRIHIIDDASPDTRLRGLLERFASDVEAPVLVEANPENLGFVKTVNKGLQASDCDVIILNSDTLVHGDWVDRMVRAGAQRADVATVTPFSNNATICSYPEFCAENELAGLDQVARLDRIFARANTGQVEQIPTGIGFCMLITRRSIADLGVFDADKFGIGYGEENDFCMRAREAGWINVAACDVYVGHSGGESFGRQKQHRINRALRVLEEAYPGYEGLIADFCARDPLRRFRVASWLEALQEDAAKPLIASITHGWGGGSEKFLREWVRSSSAQLRHVCVSSDVNGAITLHHPLGLSTGIEIDVDELEEILHQLGTSRLFVNQFVDHPPEVWNIILESGIPYDMMLHDYYLISGNPTDPDAPEIDDEPINTRFPQSLAARVLARADKCFTPSQAARDLFLKVYPHIRVVVAPHNEPMLDEPLPVRPSENSGRHRVLVIGALSKEKGADLLEAVADLAWETDPSLEFLLVGYAYRELSPRVLTTGAYEDAEVLETVARLQPTLVWFPAQWHETYSYTLSVIFKLGLPVLVSDAGAFPERCVNRPLSWIYPMASAPDEVMGEIESALEVIGRAGEAGIMWRPGPGYDLAADIAGRVQKTEAISIAPIRKRLSRPQNRFGNLILQYRQMQFVRPLIALLPSPLKLWILRRAKLIN